MERSRTIELVPSHFAYISEKIGGDPPSNVFPIYLTVVSLFLVDLGDDEPEERWKSRFAREYSFASRLAEVPELTCRPRHRPPSLPSRPPRGDIRKRPRAISGAEATPRTNDIATEQSSWPPRLDGHSAPGETVAARGGVIFGTTRPRK